MEFTCESSMQDQRLAIPAPAADAPCSLIAPRKMPRACIPKWPRGASPPHFTHHLLPLTPKSSSVKCDSCTNSHGGTAQGTAARRDVAGPAAPPPVLPRPPPLHHEPTRVCRLDHLQVHASLGHDLASPTSERPRQAGHQPAPSMAPESLRFYSTGTADVTDEDSIGVNKEAVRTEGAAQTAGAQADWRPRGPFSAPVPQGTRRPAGGRGSAGSSQKLLAAFWGLSVKQECQGSRSQCVGLRVAVTGQRAVGSVTGSHHLCPMALPRACAGVGRGAGYPGRVNGAAKQEGKKPRGCRRCRGQRASHRSQEEGQGKQARGCGPVQTRNVPREISLQAERAAGNQRGQAQAKLRSR